jgi:oligopeptide/dipeptide ABC transporter ATP-binding protein
MEKTEFDYLLKISDLKMHFPVKAGIVLDHVVGWVKALDGIDLTIKPRQVLGMVGESGSGKTTLSKALLLLEKPTHGEVLYEGKDIHSLVGPELKAYRRTIQAVFQDPFASLSPRLRVRQIISEPLEVSSNLSRKELDARAVEALRTVGLDTGLIKVYPHELSGGQRQRVAIARAISTDSKIIILDEPTSALDVSIRLQIIHLLMDLQKNLELTYLLIGHDLAMVAYMSTDIAVMYLGKIVELGETKELLTNTAHPYTQALIAASLPDHPRLKQERTVIIGEIASPLNIPSGCRFHPRCPGKKPICEEREPPLVALGKNHWVACHVEGQ